MQTLKQVVALALEEAQAGFGSLCRRMTDDADAALGEIVRSGPVEEQRRAGMARLFLREQGQAFRARMEHAYAGLLVRAMQTMHTDLRTGLHDFRADTLTLIDDEVVTRQIEVERLLLRLRDADELSLGHLNLIIAQIHGASEVRERENPFRPYLLARTLYDALTAMVPDEALCKMLYDRLAASMTAQLGDFYTRLREVFESRGVRSRLVARPSALDRRQRERLAWQRAVSGLEDADLAMRQRVARLSGLQQAAAANEPAVRAPALHLQELISDLFNHTTGRRLPRPGHDGGRLQLDARLRQLQRDHAAQDDAAVSAPLALLDTSDSALAINERLVIDLVALLFEFIKNDDMLPPAISTQLCRLHAPFVRAALMEQAVLYDIRHPARALLDRVCSAATGIRESETIFAALVADVTRVVSHVLQRFEQDDAVFAEAEQQLEGFLEHLLRQCDPAVRRCTAALERAEKAAPLQAAAAEALRTLLAPLKIDLRMADFIANTWSMVIVHTAGREPDFSKLLPELVWSAQEKATAEERSQLMKMLPELGRRLRAGLAAIGMPEQAAQSALDQLVSLHMDVLGNKLAPATVVRMPLAKLREHFAQFRLEALGEGSRAFVPPGYAQLAAEFALLGIVATIHAGPDWATAQADDEDLLHWARPATAFEMLSGATYLPLRLGAVASHDSVFLFTEPGQAAPVVYTRAALLAAMREGSLRPFEYASLFERAAESLMTGAESLGTV